MQEPAPAMPPHSDEAEQAVIGALLLDNDAWGRVAGIIGEPDFYRGDHRAIWHAAAGLIEAGQPADVVTVGAALEASRELDQAGGLGYLAALAHNTPSAANAGHYAGIVAEKAKRRALAALGNRLADAATGAEPLADLAAKAADELAGLAVSKQAAQSRLLVPVGELIGQPARVEWLVRGMIERESLALLFGDSGAGKSFVALGITAAIATGTDWHGHRTAAGPVAFLAGEGHGGISRRLKAIEIHQGIGIKDAPIFVSRRAVAMLDAKAVDALVSELDALPEPPALIVIDTVARAMSGGDENAASDVSGFVAACDRLKSRYRAAVLLIHHVGHGSKDRARGSSALRASLDVEMLLSRPSGTDGVVSLTATKLKDGAPFAPHYFEMTPVSLPWLDDDGEPINSAVLTPADHAASDLEQASSAAALSRHDVQALDVLRELSAKAAASIGEWRKACEERGILAGKTPEATERAMSRTKSRLLSAGLIEPGIRKGIYLPTASKVETHDA